MKNFTQLGKKIKDIVKLQISEGSKNIKISEDHLSIGKVVFEYELDSKKYWGEILIHVKDKGQYRNQ